jgi:hypothetical protein
MLQHWLSLLANEPYHVPANERGKLTNREMFDLYFEVGLRRSQQMKHARDGSPPGNTIDPDPDNAAEAEAALAFLKMILGPGVPNG